jgi:hypothetical protein
MAAEAQAGAVSGAVMSAPARPFPAGQRDVLTCLACGMTGPSADSRCLAGRRLRPRAGPSCCGTPGRCSR